MNNYERKLKKDTKKIHYASTPKLAYVANVQSNYPDIEIIALDNI